MPTQDQEDDRVKIAFEYEETDGLLRSPRVFFYLAVLLAVLTSGCMRSRAVYAPEIGDANQVDGAADGSHGDTATAGDDAMGDDATAGDDAMAGDDGNDRMAGRWIVARMGSDLSLLWTAFSEATFDGQGQVTDVILSDSANAGGTTVYTYTVDADGTLTDELGYLGAVDSTNNHFGLVDIDPADGVISVLLGTKMSSGKTLASYNGDFYLLGFGTDNGSARAALYGLAVDGNGTSAYTTLWDSTGGTAEGSDPYTVNDDGTGTVSTGDHLTQGILSSDDEVAVGVDTSLSPDALSLQVGIKQSAGLTNTSATGVYSMTAIGYNTMTQEVFTTHALLDLDGAGNFTTHSQSSSPSLPTSGSGTYAVSADGRFQLTMDGYDHDGVIKRDGNIIAVTDVAPSVDLLTLQVAIRLP
ncbi:hypothetical protein ACFL6C_08430 [Myxococcota bacterium]